MMPFYSSRRAAPTERVPVNAFAPPLRRTVLAFTLFEVAISLAILAFGVISIMMLFPAGLKAQHLSRFQLYAAAKAEEMIEQFNTAQADNATADTEGTDIWQVPSSYRSQTWDVDARVSSHRYGMMPLPLDLARRLDSDGDEIQQILGEGGYIYYSQPQASTGMAEKSVGDAPPNEAQKLIIGITGYAQQNAMPIFPMKNWPYFANFPSPPLHYVHMSDPWLPPEATSGANYFVHYRYPKDDYESFTYCWETARVAGLSQPIPGTDPDMQKVFDWPEGSPAVHYGYFPYACGRQWDHGDKRPTKLGLEDGDHPNREAVIRYVQAALWYCQQKSLVPGSGITSTFWSDPHSGNIPTFSGTTPDHKKWMQVQAMRFLSHAATCLTAWYPLTATTGVDDLTTGVRIPSVVLDGRAGPPELRITNELIRYYHERGLKLAMSFAASFPYDWAVPRPVERSIMTDFPLLQYDMFPTGGGPSDPVNGGLAGNIFGSGVIGRQWRPLAPRPIRNIGLSQTYPINVAGTRHKLEGTQISGAPSNLFGDADHYSLTMPFEASERCRELVFWTVDWQSYEDFETLPSAPVDASRYPLAGPRNGVDNPPKPWQANVTRDFNGRMWDTRFVDPHLFCFRNPEKNMLWVNNIPRGAATGTDVTGHQLLHNDEKDWGADLDRRQVFSGIWGADRNYNKKVDRGPVPKSVRLRAVQVARFNFYDPRIVCLLR
jgi:hypothetical protein